MRRLLCGWTTLCQMNLSMARVISGEAASNFSLALWVDLRMGKSLKRSQHKSLPNTMIPLMLSASLLSDDETVDPSVPATCKAEILGFLVSDAERKSFSESVP